MSQTNFATTQIPDYYGKQHEYKTVFFGALEARKLDIVLSQYMAQIAAGVAGSAKLEKHGDNLLDADLSFDGKALGVALNPLVNLLCGDDQFVIRLLQHTTRDGVNISTGINFSAQFDKMYQRGLAEFKLAVLWVIEENFADPLLMTIGHMTGVMISPAMLTAQKNVLKVLLQRSLAKWFNPTVAMNVENEV